ncbi:MAG: hypothetical protein ACI4K9_07080 [Candidatus Fimenecus sp.]
MFEKKEDTYKGYSETYTQPLRDAADSRFSPTETDAPIQPNTYRQPQQPYAPVQPNTYGQPQQPYAPVQPNTYGQPQQPYAPVQPNTYGQPQMYAQTAYPYAPGQPPKRHSVGKTIAIVIACIVGVNLLLFGGVVAYVALQSPEKKIEAYEQSGNLADLIDACNIYDNQMPNVDDPVAAEQHFETALSDTKTFLRAFKDAECADYYQDDTSAYNAMMTDWLCLMLINGQYDKYNEVFVKKMLEYSPSGNYYFDTYTLMYYIENEYITLTEPQKQAALSAFDALIAASTSEEERQLNLGEYYDFCETLGEYDKADEIERQLNEDATEPAA